MHTRQIKVVEISEKQFEKEIANFIPHLTKYQIKKVNQALNEIVRVLKPVLKSNHWIYISNKDVYYNCSVAGLFPNPASFPFGHCLINRSYNSSTFYGNFGGYSGTIMTFDEFKRAFVDNYIWFEKQFPFDISKVFFTVNDTQYCFTADGTASKKWGGFSQFAHEESYHIPIYRLDKPNSVGVSEEEAILCLLREELLPQALPKKLENEYLKISKMAAANKDYFQIEDGKVVCNAVRIMEDVMEEKLDMVNGETINKETVKERLLNDMPLEFLSQDGYEELITKLLTCDTIRCDIESYDEKILTDPNRGHWDLWEESKDSSKYTAKLKNGLIARNPLIDVNYDGVIAIDFGTKSTVVVYQDNTEHVLPMRIGTGQLSKKVEAKHYENPTVMELIDLDNFLTSYFDKKGRPETIWEDLTISHTANSSMLNSNSVEYYSFFNELKQWAGDKRRQIRLKDKQNKDILLPPFSDIKEGEFDPIEIYAYYIGLYINNMHNSIYLDYILSFPVTYENAVRKKITESFERGLKKSLPITVLEDETAMERFRVLSGISEPAAYAICALEECASDLQEGEQVYYGIFDFGGGTTDFDYGVWREADPRERKYDYVLECFGAGGDQFLGGENLLELLAFEVFKDNQDKLRAEGISFVLPPECAKFPGSEILLSNSQEAKLNMRQLMEMLRPFWEQQPGYEDLYQDGTIKVTLFTKTGEPKVNFELVISMHHMDEILRKRINKGVINFFEGLKAAFHLPAPEVSQVHIFLAGNSSRSKIVTELFDEYIQSYSEALLEEGLGCPEELFVVYPPLGFRDLEEMEAAKAAQLLETGEEQSQEDLSYITRPTGKTGVAFGLIEGRPGGRIKVVLPDMPKDITSGDMEIKFKYYIGYKKKTCFRIISDRDIPYGQWIELYDASEQDFSIYYTSLPEALTNQMSILDVNKKNCRLKRTYKNANIYYRLVAPTEIEYVVAREEDLEKGEYLEDIVHLELS